MVSLSFSTEFRWNSWHHSSEVLVYELKNEALVVSVLDPVADRDRLGTRYCTGGYIFQVADADLGDLMSGPTYPDDFNAYDGQGIPDAFNRGTLSSPDTSTKLVIGIGICDLEADEVTEFCSWDVQSSDSSIAMTTSHVHGPHALDLERTITLRSRTLRSSTFVRNTGKRPIPLNWFPHPFYPHTDNTDELCRLNVQVSFPDNDGFEWADSGFISRKHWPWEKGHYQALDHHAQANLVVQQKHPKLGLVGATFSYVPDFFPIWGNTRTFSWEPFYERTLAPGQTTTWWIDYQF
jgi:hypothetical protein